MKYLNLSEGFNPFDAHHMDVIKHKQFVFSGGEPHIKLSATFDEIKDGVMVTTRIVSSKDMIMLMLAMDALKRVAQGMPVKIGLFLPYFPGARQDRTMVDGEPLTSKVYADLINSLGFSNVGIIDPHSTVTPALINNCFVYSTNKFVHTVIEDINRTRENNLLLVSPDVGAIKRTEDVGKLFKMTNDQILIVHKSRDLDTGKIKKIDLLTNRTDLGGADCVIIDDICDGGGTFLGVAAALKRRNAGRLFLVVTHGIFSKGFRELNQAFDAIYTTDSFPNIDNVGFQQRWDNKYYKVKQIPLKNAI